MSENAEVAQHEQSGGESELSFKEVESLTSETTDSELVQQAKQMVKDRAEQKENTIENAKKMVEKAKARKEEKEAEASGEHANRETPKDQSPKDLEGAKQDMSEQVEQELVEEIKKLNAKYKEDDIEIPADAIFKHKVDGNEVEVSAQELLNNYSGKVPWDKRFQELDADKRNFRAEKAEVENYVNTFNKKFEEGGTLEAMIYLAELGGKDPLEVRRQFRADALRVAEQFSQLDENQRAVFEKNEENEFLQQKLESEKASRESEAMRQQTLTEIRKIQETYSLNDENILSMNDELIEAGVPADQVTPAMIEQYIREDNAYKQAEAVLEQIDSELLQNDEAVESLKKVAIDNPEFNSQDLLDIAKSAYGIEEKKVSKKAKAAAQKSKEDKPKPKAKARKETLFFSDLD